MPTKDSRARRRGGVNAIIPKGAGLRLIPDNEKRVHLARSARVRNRRACMFGSTKIYSSPKILMEAVLEYFQWCIDNPQEKSVTTYDKNQGEYVTGIEYLPRMATVTGLSIYLGICRDVWYSYNKIDEYKPVCNMAADYMDQERITGASNGLLNASFVARYVGLVNRTAVTADVKVKNEVDLTKLSPEAIKEIAALNIDE